MGLKTYDPKDVVLTVGGVPIGGYADGTFINYERTSDAYSVSSGADGDATRVKSNDNTASLTMTLAQTSDSNSVLSGLALLDELSNSGVVPVILKEIGADTAIFSSKAWIRKIPAKEYAKEISNVEWVMDMAESTAFLGGNAISGII